MKKKPLSSVWQAIEAKLLLWKIKRLIIMELPIITGEERDTLVQIHVKGRGRPVVAARVTKRLIVIQWLFSEHLIKCYTLIQEDCFEEIEDFHKFPVPENERDALFTFYVAPELKIRGMEQC